MLSTPPPVQGPHTPAPNLISRHWWKRNVVVVLVGISVLVVIVVGVILGSSQLLFLLPKKTASVPFVPSIEPVVPTPVPVEKKIGDVVVPKEVGEDNFYLKPVEFDEKGMGLQSEISLTSKVDMDTEAVLFRLVLDPVFAYDVVSTTPREIRIKPKEPFIEGNIYHFRLPTSYKVGDTQVNRLYKWGYEAIHPSIASENASTQDVSREAQQRLAQDTFRFYPVSKPLNSPPPLNEDQNHGVVPLSLVDAIPFDRLPLLSDMDIFIIPKSISSLWERALLHFQDRDDVHGIVSAHVMKAFFEHVGTGTSRLTQPVSVSDTQSTDTEQLPSVFYSDNDLSITELLALIAYTDPTWLPAEDLKAYFRSIYFSPNSTASLRAQSAFGLASLGEPYLQEQVNLLNDHHLTPIDRLFLGLGLDRMGATEYTVLIYRDTLKDYMVKKEGGSFIETLQSSERNQYATLLTALAGFTFDREDAGLRQYLDSDQSGNGSLLHTFYLTQRAGRGDVGTHSFEITFDTKHNPVTFDGLHKLAGEVMTAPLLKTLKITGDTTGFGLLISY